MSMHRIVRSALMVAALATSGCTGGIRYRPVASAGPDQVVAIGDTATLDGTASEDADGVIASYAWTLISAPQGSAATLSASDTAQPELTTDLTGLYVVSLTVTDNDGLTSAPDVVTIHALPPDEPPVALLTSYGAIGVNATVVLDGSESYDPEGDPLSYLFNLEIAPPGSSAELVAGTDAAHAQLTPDLAGTWVVSLTVNDGQQDSRKATAIFDVGTTVNRAPVALCGGDQAVVIGTEVVLDGSASYDPEGDSLSYEWSLATPDGSAATLSATDAVNPTFTADMSGDYIATLRVADGTLWSDPCTTKVAASDSVSNHPPTADAGGDQTIRAAETPVYVDGSGSTDPDGDALTYAWSLVTVPTASSLTPADITPSDQVQAEFTPDVEGSYVVELTVCDFEPLCDTDIATIDVGNASSNHPPVADAGPDQSVTVGDVVRLDGSGTYDVDGDPLTYHWSITSAPSGSAASIDSPDSVASSFTPDVAGDYLVTLEVSDGRAVSTDSLIVTATSGGTNHAPTCDAGSSISATLGDVVTLDGSGTTDVDGDSLTYQWTFDTLPSGSALSDADIAGSTTVTPSFVPDVAGTYVLALTADDGSLSCHDTVTVDVSGSGTNTCPVADAGSDQTVSLGDTVTLDGSGSYDPDGDSIWYHWKITSAPSGSSATIASPYDATTTFTPDVAGSYTLRLLVSDTICVGIDTITVTVTGSGGNTCPVADAGSDQTVSLGDTVTLDGSGSYDPDGDSIWYHWKITSAPSGSSATIASPYDATTTFTPDVAGSYTLRLLVSDTICVGIDTITVTASGGGTGNTPPVADAGSDVSQCGYEPVMLDGSGSSDADGDSLTYEWTFSSVPSGSALTDADISGANTATPEFTPDVEGSYVLALEVDDGVDTDTDTVTVTVDSDDAVLVLHLDDGSGTVATDAGPDANDGTVSGGAWGGGRFFGDYEFDGSSGIVVPDSPDLRLRDEFTIDWWMRSDAVDAYYETILMKGYPYNYSVWTYGTTLAFYGQMVSGRYAFASATTTGIGDGSWHHYAVTLSGGAITFYEDGTAIGTGSVPRPLRTNSSRLFIGRPSYSSTAYTFKGGLDELVIRSRALDASEVAALASATTQFCTGDEDTTAPEIAITSPSSGSTTDHPYVAVTGTASDESAITSITVNGVEAVATDTNFATWVAYVPLSAGSNTLAATAEDAAGNTTTSSPVTVDYEDTCAGEVNLELRFDEETGGTASDDSPNGLDATERGTDRVIGKYGNAARFNGTSDYDRIADDAALDFSGPFSVEWWYRRDGSTSDWEILFMKGTNYNYAGALNGQYLAFGYTDTSGNNVVAWTSGFNDGDWHHVVGVYDGSSVDLYVDGALEGTATATLPPTTNSDSLYLGAYAGASYHLDGDIDQLRIYDRALSASEVGDLYAGGEACAVSSNLALLGTATASSTRSVLFPADAVIDGATAEESLTDYTMWLGRNGTSAYVTVDLGALVGVTSVRWANTHNRTLYDRATEDYEIAVSPTGAFNGEETVIDTGTGTLETDLVYHTVDLTTPVAGRYVRFTADTWFGYGPGVNEIQVFGLE